MLGKIKLALHPTDNRRQRFAGLIAISCPEPNTYYSPIRGAPSVSLAVR
jgi:hypothetical protein